MKPLTLNFRSKAAQTLGDDQVQKSLEPSVLFSAQQEFLSQIDAALEDTRSRLLHKADGRRVFFS